MFNELKLKMSNPRSAIPKKKRNYRKLSQKKKKNNKLKKKTKKMICIVFKLLEGITHISIKLPHKA